MTKQTIELKKVTELKEMAKELGIKVTSSMRKADIIEAILSVEVVEEAKYLVDVEVVDGSFKATVTNVAGITSEAKVGANLESIMKMAIEAPVTITKLEMDLTNREQEVAALTNQVTDLSNKYTGAKNWFKENMTKDASGNWIMKDAPQVTITKVDKVEAPVTKGEINYHECVVDISNVTDINVLSKGGRVDPWSGREISERVAIFLMNEKNAIKIPLQFRGIALDYENQTRIKAGLPLVTKKEIQDRRRKALLKGQKEVRQEITSGVVIPPIPNTNLVSGQPLF